MSAQNVTTGTSDEVVSEGPVITIVNEFADIRIQKVYTRNGERLRVVSYRRGTEILLDAIQLESLTWQSPDDFSRLLTASVGPDTTGFDSSLG
ncbi:dihydrodiol dehydrogenase [Streptomyces sp. NPDC005774]|uniref:dihydrodiol dehydrogenase n=1 Tax=Streptomyces TaxID=1883 RepID=UPI0033DCE6C3